MDTDDREILAVLDGIYTAWGDYDADAFAAFYTEDATSVRPGSYSDGRTAIRDRMAAGFAGPLKGSRVRDEVQSVRRLGDAAAVILTRSAILMADETEPPGDRWVLATWTLTRQNGRWLLAAYHNCPA